MRLAEKIDNAPDLLYDTYDTKYTRIHLDFDRFHNNHGNRFTTESKQAVDAESEKREEFMFGHLVFETKGETIVDSKDSSTSANQEFETAAVKIHKLIQSKQQEGEPKK